MKFQTECTVIANNNMDVVLPDMTSRWLIPARITIHQLTGPKGSKVEEHPYDISCRVYAGSSELVTLNEPFFQHDNELDFEPYWGIIEKSGRVKVNINNKVREPRDFRIVTEYVESNGAVIYQERTDNFDTIVEHIAAKGRCSMITISFDKHIEELSFLTTSTCTVGNWIESFSAGVSGEEELRHLFVFDFRDDDMVAYGKNLKYLKLRVKPKLASDNVRAYVTAYGFPN